METLKFQNRSHLTYSRQRCTAEILPIRRKTLSNPSINIIPFKCLSQRKPCKMVQKEGFKNVQIKHGSERALYGGMNSAI